MRGSHQAGQGQPRSRSIRLKLIAAFLVVSVLPMLVATELATQLVVSTFEANLRTWLYETSRFFFGNVLDERKEIVGIAESLIQQGTLDDLALGRTTALPPSLVQLMDALGYDVLAIYDDKQKIVFSNRPVTQLSPANEVSLYTIDVDGRPTLMAGAIRPFQAGGRTFAVMLGIFIDENYISNINAFKSFEVRLWYRQDETLMEFFSSREGAQLQRPLRADVAKALEGGAPYVFHGASDGSRLVGVYTPLNGADGKLVGVIFCGIRPDTGLAGWVNRTNIFVAIFLVGSLLAILGAFIVARQFTRPLLRLTAGVRAVSAGDFTQQVDVQGRDEVAELAVAFNTMTRELARLREVEAKMRRQERLSTLGEVAAGLAHEVRNPLGIIKTTAELLQRSPALNEAETRRLGYVVEEVRRIESLIRDFLSFAKTPQVRSLLQPEEIVERAVAFTQQEAERRRVGVRFGNDAPGAAVMGDPGQIYDAVLNLILNALDAVPEGGHLAITQVRRGDTLVLVFADDGPGVAPEILPRLFDPFVTSKASGTGLGLAKVFAVMETHGGRVHYAGSSGGAVFELHFPLEAGGVP